MKRNDFAGRVVVCLSVLALGGAGLVWMAKQGPRPPLPPATTTTIAAAVPALPETRSDPVGSAQPPAAIPTAPPRAQSPSRAPLPAADQLWERVPPEPAFARFADWTRRYLAAGPAEQAALAEEGIALAQARRSELRTLIESDPRRAIELAVPVAVRDRLPAAVVSLLEARVSGRGEFAVLGALPLPGREAEVPPVQRAFTVGEQTFRAFVYGQRLEHPTKRDLPLNGVAIDGALAVNENPVRLLEAAEAAKLADTRPAEAICSVSGEPATVANEPTPVDVGGEIRWLCRYKHAEVMNERLLAAAGQPDSGSLAESGGPLESPYTEGRKRLILFRVAFPDVPTPALTVNAGQSLITDCNAYWRRVSYGRTSIALPGEGSDVVLVTLSLPSTNYDDDAGRLRNDVRAAATAGGVDLGKYDFDITCTGSDPSFSFAGLGYVGAPGAWLANGYFGTGTAVHELGHNLNFPHANFWDTGGRSAVGPGGNQEYGDPYDVMGGGDSGAGDYVVKFKWRAGWIADADYPRIAASGTYRIYAQDHPDARGLRGLRFRRDAALDYSLEFRQRYTGNPWMMNGIGLRWGSTDGSSSQLIDTTPGSSQDKSDAAIVIGRTFSDPAANVHITPVAKGNTYPESLDVVVNFGAFPGNVPPRVALVANTLATGTGGEVTFTAEASDPNGDPLAYHWDFGDNTVGENQPAIAHIWNSPGEYVVRCTVSDLKGGVTSDSVIVRVGTPSTFRISGRVLYNHRPVEGVLVRASGSRYAYTDSDGTYTITRLAAGNYTVSAQLHPYTFISPFGSAAVTVGPNASGIDFLRVDTPQNDVRLVANGAVWKYLANGSNPGASWAAPAFNDAGWASGPAQLGYGDGDEGTTLGYGPDPENKFVAYYFRRAFAVTNVNGLTNFALSFLRDDGGIVYLNGVEVLRDNMPAGAVTHTTLAVDNSEDTTVINVDPARFVEGTNVLAVEVHQVLPSSSDLSFDLSLTATTVTNLNNLAAVYLASPADGAVITAPSSLVLAAAARSSGAPFTMVEFFANGAKLGEDTAAPFSLAWSSPPLGSHTLTVRATGAGGVIVTSAPVNIRLVEPTVTTPLISRGAVWKYLDNGSNQGTAWRAPGFNDTAWASGPAELGYGDNDEATRVGFGAVSSNKHITTYFRRAWPVADPSLLTNLTLRLLRDDGAVVYLNGTEVHRNNLPAGTILHTTLALEAVEDDGFIEAAVDPALLVAGNNVIAVEIHQQSGESSDISFDLELLGRTDTSRPPGVELVTPVDGQSAYALNPVAVRALAVPAPGASIAEVEFRAGAELLGVAPGPPYEFSWANPPVGSFALTAVALQTDGTRFTSGPVNLTVKAPVVGRELVSPGAQWRYLDDGSNPGAAWTARSFNDGAWSAGYARLGYGGDGEFTTISYGPDPSRRHITTYFRHAFTAAGSAGLSNLKLRLARDDGAVVYLNGAEVYRNNLRDGTVSFNSLALTALGGMEERAFVEADLSPNRLVVGVNVIAVEVHQAAPDSSDLGFDLALIAEADTNLASGVYLTRPATESQYIAPASLTLEAFAVPPAGDAVIQVEFYAGATRLGAASAPPYTFLWAGAPLGEHALTATAHLAGGGALTSGPVQITVAGPPLQIASVFDTYINAGAVWRYSDTGANLGSAWRQREFDDRAWPAGAARLGFGLDGESTRTASGRITTYFRRWFNVANPALIENLILQLQRDDGAAVYLNGVEILRSNLPAGGLTYSTLASATVDGLDEQQFFLTVLPASGLVAGTNLLAVEVHQAAATSSDLGFDLHLNGSGTTEPRAVLGAPPHNAVFTAPATVPLEAYVWPGNGRSVARVEFLANGSLIAERTALPFATAWTNPPIGVHTLTVRAADNFGAGLTSAPVTIRVGHQVVTTAFIPVGSVWKFLDNGSNQGTAWAQLNYNDTAWAAGPARLGYGGDGEVTTVSYGANANNKHITTYFRRKFVVPEGVTYTNLTFQLLRDDGAVVWLNGLEAFRSNMPATPVTYTTLSGPAVANSGEQTFYPTVVPANRLLPGTNVVAVEIHQATADSSDLGFDLGVTGTGYIAYVPPPELAITNADGALVLTWSTNAPGFTLEENPDPTAAGGWTPITNAPVVVVGNRKQVTLSISPGAAARFYRLKRP